MSLLWGLALAERARKESGTSARSENQDMSGGAMDSTTLTTVPARKAAEAARRVQAAHEAIGELARHARDNGGRFIVFGSYVTGTMRFDSDLDLLIDFPRERSGDAWRFAEDVCARLALPVDLHDAITTKPAFVERVLAGGLVLS